jgi:hypothetical protein
MTGSEVSSAEFLGCSGRQHPDIAMAPRSGVDMGNQPAAGSCPTPGFKRFHCNAPFPPQEMNTIEQARRVLDRAFTARITENCGAVK